MTKTCSGQTGQAGRSPALALSLLLSSTDSREGREKYSGYLQADAAPCFDDVYQKLAILEVGCWAHARRRFKDAVRTSPREATQVMVWIGELYGIERSAKGKRLVDEERRVLRRERSRPILNRINDYLRQITVTALPKSPLGDAIGYALRQWNALCRYTEDGGLEIDNNGAENALRPLCLGRKNWLFIGSEAAAHRTMVLLTLVQTVSVRRSTSRARSVRRQPVLRRGAANRGAATSPDWSLSRAALSSVAV